jgi:hypothetical protein
VQHPILAGAHRYDFAFLNPMQTPRPRIKDHKWLIQFGPTQIEITPQVVATGKAAKFHPEVSLVGNRENRFVIRPYPLRHSTNNPHEPSRSDKRSWLFRANDFERAEIRCKTKKWGAWAFCHSVSNIFECLFNCLSNRRIDFQWLGVKRNP